MPPNKKESSKRTQRELNNDDKQGKKKKRKLNKNEEKIKGKIKEKTEGIGQQFVEPQEDENISSEYEIQTKKKVNVSQNGNEEVEQETQEKKNIKDHITFLNQLSEENDLTGFDDQQNEFFEQGKDIIRLKTNPPFYLRDDLNRFDDVQKYSFDLANSDPQYIRSAKHPFWLKDGYSNDTEQFGGILPSENIYTANQGGFINTFTAITGKTGKKKAENNPSITSQSNEGGQLYDRHLDYKNTIINDIVKRVKDNDLEMTVGSYNEYPNLMVHLKPEKLIPNLFDTLGVKALRDMVEDDDSEGNSIKGDKTDALRQKLSDGKLMFRTQTKQAFTLFMMSYYMGLVNKISEESGLNIFMAERQSFGYDSPSIAETVDSFRVNIGLMPPEYADVHVEALKIFNKEIKKFNTELKNSKISPNPFGLAGNAKAGQIRLFTLHRNQQPKNNINAMAFNGKSIKDAMQQTVSGMDGNRWNPKKKVKDEFYEDSSIGIEKVEIDEKFYNEIITPYQASLTNFLAEQSDEDPYTELNNQFKEAINDLNQNNIPGEIVEKFDVIQDYLATYALLHTAKNKTFDDFGYGSESEAEEDSELEVEERGSDIELDEEIIEEGKQKREKGKLRIKKIITHNGMRALMNPIFHEISKIPEGDRKGYLPINYRNTYYEISDLIDNSKFKEVLGINWENDTKKESPFLKDPSAPILMRDANAIVLDGNPTAKLLDELKDSKSPVWIIDTTSATQSQMQEIVDQFRANEKGEMLYLVSSGFKNEQGGADKNSYGTIRVVSKDADAIDAALDAVKNTDGPLAEVSHEYRRILKDIGMVPRDQEILKRPNRTKSFASDMVEEEEEIPQKLAQNFQFQDEEEFDEEVQEYDDEGEEDEGMEF